jgi:hypothetical protein
MRPTNITVCSSLSLGLDKIEVRSTVEAKGEPVKTIITDPEARRRLSADLANVKHQLTRLLADAVRKPDGSYSLGHLPPWQARQIQREVEELQALGREIESLLEEK